MREKVAISVFVVSLMVVYSLFLVSAAQAQSDGDAQTADSIKRDQTFVNALRSNETVAVDAKPQVMQRLAEAQKHAQDEERSGSTNAMTDAEYYRQDARLRMLIDRLQKGDAVSVDDVDEALSGPSGR
jgi:hypothetical protein